MAAELAISRDWEFESAKDDTIREAVIKKTAEIFRYLEGDSGIAAKVLNNDNCNGAGENVLQENIKLIQLCRTRSELTLLLRTVTMSTLHRIYEGYNLLSFPYGGGSSNHGGLLIRDFVEYEFQKREGKKFGAYFEPHSLVNVIPAPAFLSLIRN